MLKGAITELRRRNVFRVASVYAVVGWLLMQLGVVLESTLNLPGWFDTLITVLVLLGFPVALILAWAFEMTPDGMRPTPAMGAAAPVSPAHARAKKTTLNVMLAGALVAALGFIAFDRTRHGDTHAPSSRLSAASPDVTRASLAVLPFADMSQAGDQQYFADGISEELLNAFARVDGMDVAGRSSAFAFKNTARDIREIADILGVDHVLEGSVRKAGQRIRITAQLIRADTGLGVWSDTYDRDLTDIFAIQDDIAATILAELAPRLIPTDTTPRTDVDAYDLYLLAKTAPDDDTLEGVMAAIAYLDAALAIDPDFVPALTQRGYAELLTSDAYGALGTTPYEDVLPRARTFIDRAIELAPGSADALYAEATLHLFGTSDEDVARAEDLYQRALAIRPNFPELRSDYGFLLMTHNRLDEAEAQFENVLSTDPANYGANTNLISLFRLSGRMDAARARLERWRAIRPDAKGLRFTASLLERQDGHLASAKREIEAAMNSSDAASYFNVVRDQIDLELGVVDTIMSDPDNRYHARAHALSGQTDRARTLALASIDQRAASPGALAEALSVLHYSGASPDIVATYDRLFDTPDAFSAYFTRPNYGAVVPALAAVDHPHVPALIADWARLVEDRAASGQAGLGSLIRRAQLDLARGDTDAALDGLERAVAGRAGDMGVLVDPRYAPLAGEARYAALRTAHLARINAERAKLDLAPMDMPAR